MKKYAVVAMFAGLLAVAGSAPAQSPITLKFSHVVAPDTPKGKAAQKFKELAEQYTNRKVKVEVYPNSTLYKDKDELDALLRGEVQMLAPSLSKFGPIGIREFEVFDLPFIVPNRAALQRVTNGPVGQRLLKLLEAKGMTGLAYWDNGFKVMSANKPLHGPEDFKGLKTRIQSSRVIDAQMRTLGATPYATAMVEALPALKSGTVDSTENTPSNMYTQKLFELQKYITVSNHGYLGYAVVTNTRFWQGLPGDIREQLTKALAEATRYGNDVAQQDNDEALDAIRKSGKTTVTELTAAEKEAWRKALQQLYRDLAVRVGKNTIDEFTKAAGAITQ